MFFPISSNTGFTLSNAACGPPIMMVSAAFFAPTSPPETGASRYSQPSSLMRCANFLVSIGEIELMSTTILPFDKPSATPLAENSTLSTSGVSGSIRMMISAFCATSFALPRAAPPAAVSSCGTPLREWRCSLCPPLIRFSAMGLPMMPRPMNPMSLIIPPKLIKTRPEPADSKRQRDDYSACRCPAACALPLGGRCPHHNLDAARKLLADHHSGKQHQAQEAGIKLGRYQQQGGNHEHDPLPHSRRGEQI